MSREDSDRELRLELAGEAVLRRRRVRGRVAGGIVLLVTGVAVLFLVSGRREVLRISAAEQRVETAEMRMAGYERWRGELSAKVEEVAGVEGRVERKLEQLAESTPDEAAIHEWVLARTPRRTEVEKSLAAQTERFRGLMRDTKDRLSETETALDRSLRAQAESLERNEARTRGDLRAMQARLERLEKLAPAEIDTPAGLKEELGRLREEQAKLGARVRALETRTEDVLARYEQLERTQAARYKRIDARLREIESKLR
jgi:flagellar capping protein FliD